MKSVATARTKLLLVAGGLLVALLGLEVASRLVLFANTPRGLLFDEQLIIRCAPHSELFGSRHNDHGDIGPDVLHPKAPNERRVFLLGGSTSHSEAYVAAVQAELNAHSSDSRYTVVSAGVPRYTSYNNLVNATGELAQLEPDAYVIYLGINDCIYNSFPWIDARPDIGYWNYRSWRRSIFVDLFRYHVIDKRFRLRPDWAGLELRSPALLERHLRELIEFSQERGIKVVLSTFALSYPTDDERLAREIERREPTMKHFWGTNESTADGVSKHNAVVRALADEYRLPIVELAHGAIPADLEHFTDICHMTDTGRTIRGRLIGRAVAAAFDEPAADPP